MMTEDATDRVARIRRAFDAAFQRMCEAENPEAAEDELSNVLSQVYRLSEVVKDKLGKGIFYKAMLPRTIAAWPGQQHGRGRSTHMTR
jgi:hypothetical protein